MKRRWTLCLCLAAAASAAVPRPKLVVVLVVDQLSADLVQRWGKDWTGGLGRLQAEGVAFTAAYHAHGLPKTAPGHSVLLSGRHPGHTGIIENNWLDRASGQRMESVEDPKVRTLGKAKGPGSGPAAFRGTTLGGWLKAQVAGSRAFAMAGKDRSAILLAGPQADGVYWIEKGVGFTTSTAYADRLPGWLQTFDAGFLERLRNHAFWWEPSAPIPPGRTLRGQWNVDGRLITGRLPIQVNGAGMALDEAFWKRWDQSPYLDEAVFEGAEALMDAEGLGNGAGTDLLALGLSSTDFVGHAYGNAGEEMYDQLRRLDARLEAFIAKVRKKVPEAWFVLTADHGAEDFPERLVDQGYAAKRLRSKPWLDDLRKRLRERFKVEGDPLRSGSTPGQLYLNDAVMGVVGATRADMLRAVLEEVKAMPEVAEAATSPELEGIQAWGASPEGLSIREQLALSHVPGRSGDIVVAFKPHRAWDGPPKEQPATHGAPYDYDRRVPLFFLGPWKAERRTEPVRTVDLAATLAAELGLRPGEPIDGKALPLKAR